jgi:hypothetical protein
MATQSTTNTEATSPTGDIKIFIDTFNSDFDIEIQDLSKSQNNLKNIYADAIKISTPRTGTWPKEASVVTIGDLFKYTFPDITTDTFIKPPDYIISNGVSSTVDDSKKSDYKSWEADFKSSPDIKDKFDNIKKGLGANAKLSTYNSVKKPGITNPNLYSPGQYYFDVFMSQILSQYGPLKSPNGSNGGSSALDSDVLNNNGGSASVSNFDPSGETEISKHFGQEPSNMPFDYYEFSEILKMGLVGTGIKYKMINITGIDLDLDMDFSSPSKSFPNLRVQYRSGVLAELEKDPKFNIERGSKENLIPTVNDFIGNYEHMLLYKAFVQAGDNYKAVVLPYREVEEDVKPVTQTQTPLVKVQDPTAVSEVQFKFNVEKTDTFIVVGGTVSPPLELVIVPNDGTQYILDMPDDIFNNDDLGEEYQESTFVGLQEEDMVFEVAESMGIGTEVDFPTPPLDPNSPPGPDSGTSGPNTYSSDGISSGDWEKKGTVVIGSKVPSNLSGPANYNQKVKINDTIKNEYIPTIKNLPNYSNGIKLLAIVMTQKEGFHSGTRSYRTNNPGNIGNTDSGSNKSLKTLADGIKLQLDYITKVAKGEHKAYPLGKEKNMKPYYSPEIAKNNGPNGPYKGSTAFLPGYKFTYTGKIEQYCKIYSTGSRQNNSYISMIVSWFRQNGYNWVTEETTIAQLIEQNQPFA